jgi:hypothetical protein
MPSASAIASAPKTRSDLLKRSSARKSVTATVRASFFSPATEGEMETGDAVSGF